MPVNSAMPRPVGPAPVRRMPGGPIAGPNTPTRIPTYKKGGTVKKTGLALVHKGEKVTPASKAKSKSTSKKKK